MPDLPHLRSLLYVPASNEKALAKAGSLPADALIIDLEDSVAPDAKDTARDRAAILVPQLAKPDRPVFLRVNALNTKWAKDDLELASGLQELSGILLPKVETPQDIHVAQQAVGAAPSSLQLLVMIETALALLNLKEIAAASNPQGSRLAGFVLGLNDIGKETGISAGDNRERLAPVLLQTVLCARAFHLKAYDGVYNDFRDGAGFANEARQAKAFGFDGKTLIHPSQIDPVHLAFAPSSAELDEARALVAAFALPKNTGKGAIEFRGRMVELLHLEMARKLLNSGMR